VNDLPPCRLVDRGAVSVVTHAARLDATMQTNATCLKLVCMMKHSSKMADDRIARERLSEIRTDRIAVL
jgi:hypothetical protein